MERLNHLTVSITGTHIDDDGVEHAINKAYEDMDFVYLATFKEDTDQYGMDLGVVGHYYIDYWINIVEDIMRNRMNPNMFMALIEIALKNMKKEGEASKKTSYTT